ncbi:hypothetical protein ANN_15968 [Periplaneta americana]|uniref:Uncharacterized protein n=1 Tax=Periplaneta americana TaxID=6978 RepID=A0ABQ8SI43_PERAM|nr:hypothetical protein ANN_15968 [Periplaneta americana]
MPIDFYYFDASAPCQSIMMLAKTLGVELNLKEITLSAGDHRKPEFVQMNPQHCVPTINDNGFILWESRVILGYLVETYGKDDSLYPKNPKKRALVNQRLYFDIGTLYPKYILYYMPIIYQGTSPDPAHVAGFEQPLEFLEKFLEGNEWVAGNDITIADYTIGVTVSHMEFAPPQGFQFPCAPSNHVRFSSTNFIQRSSKYNIKNNENSVTAAVVGSSEQAPTVISESEHTLCNAVLRARNSWASEQLGVGTLLFRNRRFRPTVHFCNSSEESEHTLCNNAAVGYDLKKHPNISRWLEKTKNTIPSYSEIMGVGIPALLDLLEKSVKK